MAININALNPRVADRKLFLAAGVGFPLIVLTGYFRSYYGNFLFDVPSVANSLVHAHGLVMSLWVVYFSVQIALIRTKNVKIHMTMGLAGIAAGGYGYYRRDGHCLRRITRSPLGPTRGRSSRVLYSARVRHAFVCYLFRRRRLLPQTPGRTQKPDADDRDRIPARGPVPIARRQRRNTQCSGPSARLRWRRQLSSAGTRGGTGN